MEEEPMSAVGITGIGTYVPDRTITGEEIAEASGIPKDVVIEKMGVVEKHVCPPDEDHASDMSVQAAERALADAAVAPEDVDMLVYHGSEFKDHIVWSAAANIADRLGADNAFATESYTLCAGAPIALRQAVAQLQVDNIDTALLVAASREEDLVDYEDPDASFMFNFGSGAAAMVVEADPGERTRASIHGHAATTDGSFSHDVVMPAGGSADPPTEETVSNGRHTLSVPDPDGMKRRLAPVSLPAFLSVAETALDRSAVETSDVGFVALTHMKRSFHDRVLEELGLDPDSDGFYLDRYGHVQSADQILALEEGLAEGRVEPGDLVLFLAAGTGYTWAASVLRWQG